MDQFDNNKPLRKMPAFQSKAGLSFEVALYFILFLMALFWWYGDPGQEVGRFSGGLAVLGLWVYTFNRFPSVGLNCIKHPRAVFFQVPVATIATIGFIIGVYYT